MLNKVPQRMPYHRTPSLGVLIAGLAVIFGSALWLALTTVGEIRYTADHAGTRPMWHVWIPALVGLALTRLTPLPSRAAPVDGAPAPRELHRQAGALLASAVLFAAALRIVTDNGYDAEPAHTILKLVLLLAVPVLVFRLTRHGATRREPVRGRIEAWRRYGPLVPVAAWLVLHHAGPFARPPGDNAWAADSGPSALLITMIVGFAVNALLEEAFYRRWLQTRWEHVIGRWPAIVLTSLSFAAWHIGIHGTGHLLTDLTSVFVHQGVLGLFLGYLWSRYRLMWPILTVHGAINAAPVLLDML
ncbi:CPBP family intramembrane glutamic endopeptidase [Streptosporangium sp. NPDC001559]|uniref:CPBP family intramembrane glutamic endopeptidase n=1 Tax=Streptosporangium sp. NPDC001559 TaxID=3366187 RepID=UPI0036EC1FAD